MNILPKKRWHVRTKENIARVRKDEAEAAEQDKLEKLRIENANREARLRLLKTKSKVSQKSEVNLATTTETTHINLFNDFEHAVSSKNKAHEEESKEKKEDYEKKIGYLTYLGQDTNEALGKKNWYEVLPNSSCSSEVRSTYDKLILKDEDGKPKTRHSELKKGEVDWKSKERHDPLNSFKAYCHVKAKSSKTSVKSEPKSKLKPKKKSKHEKEKLIQKLREERLKREKAEQYKANVFLSGLNASIHADTATETHSAKVKPKYNSQFNPEIARQNFY